MKQKTEINKYRLHIYLQQNLYLEKKIFTTKLITFPIKAGMMAELVA